MNFQIDEEVPTLQFITNSHLSNLMNENDMRVEIGLMQFPNSGTKLDLPKIPTKSWGVSIWL